MLGEGNKANGRFIASLQDSRLACLGLSWKNPVEHGVGEKRGVRKLADFQGSPLSSSRTIDADTQDMTHGGEHTAHCKTQT